MRRLFGFRFISCDLIAESFVEFAKQAPSGLTKFIAYLNKWYMTETSVFPPSMWGNTNSTCPTTTNACESFHRHFGAHFKSPKPNMYEFLERLKDWTILAMIKARVTNMRKLVNSKNKFDELLRKGEINVIEFLTEITAKVQPPKAYGKRRNPCRKVKRFNVYK